MRQAIQFRMTAGTDVGLVRVNNEDNFIVNPDLTHSDWFLPKDIAEPLRLSDIGCVFAVADGMGGANCGEVASAIAMEQVQRSFSNADVNTIIQSDLEIIDFLKQIVVSADKSIKQHALEHSECKGMGTTLVLGWLIGTALHIVWCGDSRAYVYRPSEGLRRISKDHSRVQCYIDQGLLTEKDAFGHPESNIILRCLGDIPQLAAPDYYFYSVQSSDLILFCSDGLSAYCPDSEIEQVMKANADNIAECRNELVGHALKAGGYDNVTVALVSIQ